MFKFYIREREKLSELKTHEKEKENFFTKKHGQKNKYHVPKSSK